MSLPLNDPSYIYAQLMGPMCDVGIDETAAYGVSVGLGIWCFLHWVLDVVDHDETYQAGLADAQ